MLDRPNESGVLTGTRDFQPDPKLNGSYHLQTTCADNRDGSSIVFVTAEREDQPPAEDEADHEPLGTQRVAAAIVGHHGRRQPLRLGSRLRHVAAANAAAENKKPPATQHVHQAWYHWFVW